MDEGEDPQVHAFSVAEPTWPYSLRGWPSANWPQTTRPPDVAARRY